MFIIPSRFFSPPQLAQPSNSSYLTVKTLILFIDCQEQGILSHLLNLCVLIWYIVDVFSKCRILGFNCCNMYYATRMPGRGKSKKPPVRTGDAYVRLPLPSGVPVPMCFCGDPCKVDVSVEEDTYRQRYWMCANYAFDPTPRQIRIGLLVSIYVLST